MGKMTSEETVTEATRTDKIELSRFGEFCQRHGINPNLIMLKITLFVMYGGEYNRQSPAPFHTPSLSLSFSPFLCHPLSPVIKNQLEKRQPTENVLCN